MLAITARNIADKKLEDEKAKAKKAEAPKKPNASAVIDAIKKDPAKVNVAVKQLEIDIAKYNQCSFVEIYPITLSQVLNCPDDNGEIAMIVAAKLHKIEVMHYLFNQGANLDVVADHLNHHMMAEIFMHMIRLANYPYIPFQEHLDKNVRSKLFDNFFKACLKLLAPLIHEQGMRFFTKPFPVLSFDIRSDKSAYEDKTLIIRIKEQLLFEGTLSRILMHNFKIMIAYPELLVELYQLPSNKLHVSDVKFLLDAVCPLPTREKGPHIKKRMFFNGKHDKFWSQKEEKREQKKSDAITNHIKNNKEERIKKQNAITQLTNEINTQLQTHHTEFKAIIGATDEPIELASISSLFKPVKESKDTLSDQEKQFNLLFDYITTGQSKCSLDANEKSRQFTFLVLILFAAMSKGVCHTNDKSINISLLELFTMALETSTDKKFKKLIFNLREACTLPDLSLENPTYLPMYQITIREEFVNQLMKKSSILDAIIYQARHTWELPTCFLASSASKSTLRAKTS